MTPRHRGLRETGCFAIWLLQSLGSRMAQGLERSDPEAFVVMVVVGLPAKPWSHVCQISLPSCPMCPGGMCMTPSHSPCEIVRFERLLSKLTSSAVQTLTQNKLTLPNTVSCQLHRARLVRVWTVPPCCSGLGERYGDNRLIPCSLVGPNPFQL